MEGANLVIHEGDTLDFPLTHTTQSTSLNFTIENTGKLKASSIQILVQLQTVGASFTLTSNSCGTEVPVSGSCSVTLEFQPAADGNFSAHVVLRYYSGMEHKEKTILISGAGSSLLANLSNFPTNNATTLNVSVSGTDVANYKYKVGLQSDITCTEDSGYSSEISATNPISDALGADGDYRLCVLGESSLGAWQSPSFPTHYEWSKDSTAPTATLAGTPSALSTATALNVDIGGTDVVYYKYKFGIGIACSSAAGYSAEVAEGANITDALGTDGSYTICVVGRDSTGNYQPYASATSSSWTKDATAPIATLFGAPADPSQATVLDVAVTGADVLAYKYKFGSGINCTSSEGYSGEIDTAVNISAELSANCPTLMLINDLIS